MRISQLEAHAILHAIRFLQAGDWLEGFHPKERKAIETLRNKLVIAEAAAQRRSIPKGMTERSPDMPGIFDTPSAPTALVAKPVWDKSWKPYETSQRYRKAAKARASHIRSTRIRQRRLADIAAKGPRKALREPPPPDAPE
jgi:hypothetical protein